MATASVTYNDFQNNTSADADQVDQNFTDLVNFLNTEVLHLDGTKQMTGQLALVGDPVGDDDAVRKAYLDDQGIDGAAWTGFTPAWTNLTVGNGTNVGRYKQIGKTCVFQLRMAFGSTSAIGTSPAVALPLAAATVTDGGQTLFGYIEDPGGQRHYPLAFRINSGGTTAAIFNAYSLNSSVITSTNPIAFNKDEIFWISGTYETA